MWKRKQAIIVWEWDLQNLEEDEENRPEFETTAKTFRTNPVTKEREPYIPTWTKIYRYFVTASVVTLMVCIYFINATAYCIFCQKKCRSASVSN